MDRYNDPEALLALLLVASAWALIRALESGRLRHMLLCGAFVGLAFNTKMLEAYLVVPGLAAAFAIAGRGAWQRRLGHLLSGGLVMVVVSFTWFTTMMLIGAADRPYVGSTTDNSWFSLIFGYNGLSRLTGAGGNGASGQLIGLTRLLASSYIGGQIGWLLLLALAGLLAGLWVTRRAAREDPRRATYLLFGLWALAGFVTFSFSQGIFLPYYTTAMAPAIAALAGGGAVLMFDRFRSGWGWTAALSAAVAVTALESFLLLRDTPSFVPWLRWAVVGAAAVAVAGIVALRARARPPGTWRARLVLGAAAVALLGGPTAYSIATIGYGQTGSDPVAGPAPETGATRRAAAVNTPNAALLAFLKSHREGATYLVAADGSQAAAPIALATGDPVITIGGFSETGAPSVPAPNLEQLKAFIASGELRYVIPGVRRFAPARTGWVESHCRAVAVSGDATSSGGSAGAHVSLYLCTRADASGAAR